MRWTKGGAVVAVGLRPVHARAALGLAAGQALRDPAERPPPLELRGVKILAGVLAALAILGAGGPPVVLRALG